MKLTKLIPGILIAAVIVVTGCKKEDDDDPVNGNNDHDGYITFYTKTAGGGCGDISISLNGSSIGSLTGFTATDPECQAANASGIITVGVDIGAHDYAASDGCNHIWTGTIIINMGDCKTKELSR